MDNIFNYIFDNKSICVIEDDNGIKWYKILDVIKILNLKQKYKTIFDFVSNDYICKYNTIKHNNNATNILIDKSNDSISSYKSNNCVISNESNDSISSYKSNNSMTSSESNNSSTSNESNNSSTSNESNSSISNQLNNKTLFINNCGLIQLISKSNEYTAKKMWFELCNNIIPIIHQRGIYIQNNNELINRYLNNHNYSDNLINEYKKIFAVYVAYVGEYDGIHLLIYGKTDELTKYKLLRCREKYIQFDVIKIWEILSNDIVINNIEDQLDKTYYLYNLINLVSKDPVFNNTYPNLIKIISITDNLFLSTHVNKLLVINQKYDIEFFIKTIDEIVNKVKILGNDSCVNIDINKKIVDQYTKKLELSKQNHDDIQHKYHELYKLHKLNNKYIRRLELEFKNAEAIIHKLKNN
ncbi:hypothetical protein [Powai lake megavirus]|uniref:Bro-N domain-containing protein n=1 Tax=Powai lake megavirus TaxID=1842663 RepID=A0A167R5R1_9VIRU|nr:hypothetical protein QJ849_gp178 [Powai lake megavirus]ANB50340.1 hypothetical protein [Powai lake megavirus]